MPSWLLAKLVKGFVIKKIITFSDVWIRVLMIFLRKRVTVLLSRLIGNNRIKLFRLYVVNNE